MTAKSKSSALSTHIPTPLGIGIIVVLTIPLLTLLVYANVSEKNVVIAQSSLPSSVVSNPFPDPSSYQNPFSPSDTPYVNPFGK